MKKLFAMLCLGVMCLSGCASQNNSVETEEIKVETSVPVSVAEEASVEEEPYEAIPYETPITDFIVGPENDTLIQQAMNVMWETYTDDDGKKQYYYNVYFLRMTPYLEKETTEINYDINNPVALVTKDRTSYFNLKILNINYFKFNEEGFIASPEYSSFDQAYKFIHNQTNEYIIIDRYNYATEGEIDDTGATVYSDVYEFINPVLEYNDCIYLSKDDLENLFDLHVGVSITDFENGTYQYWARIVDLYYDEREKEQIALLNEQNEKEWEEFVDGANQKQEEVAIPLYDSMGRRVGYGYGNIVATNYTQTEVCVAVTRFEYNPDTDREWYEESYRRNGKEPYPCFPEHNYVGYNVWANAGSVIVLGY